MIIRLMSIVSGFLPGLLYYRHSRSWVSVIIYIIRGIYVPSSVILRL